MGHDHRLPLMEREERSRMLAAGYKFTSDSSRPAARLQHAVT